MKGKISICGSGFMNIYTYIHMYIQFWNIKQEMD